MKFQIYKDKKGETRWRLLADNNRIVAVSGEGYKNKTDARDAIELVKRAGVENIGVLEDTD